MTILFFQGTQADGRTYCKDKGFGDLAAVQTTEEFLVVSHFLATRQLSKGTAIYHTSGKYSGTAFVWLSINITVGDPRAPYMPYYPEFPDIYPISEESCLALYRPSLSSEVTWRVIKCSDKKYFLCRYRKVQ